MLPIVLSFIFLAFFYLKFMNSRRFLNTNLIFYHKHLIKKNSKLNLLFIGKTCNEEHPRLKPISIAFLVGFILFVFISIDTVISACLGKIYEKGVMYYINLSFAIVLISELIGTLIFCEISYRKAEKEMEKMRLEDENIMKKEIQQEWPDFFKAYDN